MSRCEALLWGYVPYWSGTTLCLYIEGRIENRRLPIIPMPTIPTQLNPLTRAIHRLTRTSDAQFRTIQRISDWIQDFRELLCVA
jgi:hypothetical protein